MFLNLGISFKYYFYETSNFDTLGSINKKLTHFELIVLKKLEKFERTFLWSDNKGYSKLLEEVDKQLISISIIRQIIQYLNIV